MPDRPTSVNFGITPATGPREITLHDGTPVSNWSPEWQEECRLRHQHALDILALPEKALRHAQLDYHERTVSPEYRRRLEAVVMSIWQARRAAVTAIPTT